MGLSTYIVVSKGGIEACRPYIPNDDDLEATLRLLEDFCLGYIDELEFLF